MNLSFKAVVLGTTAFSLLSCLTAGDARAQGGVLWYGVGTKGHAPFVNGSGVIGDAGTAASSSLTTLGITSSVMPSFAINSAPGAINNSLRFGVVPGSAATIDLENPGTAAIPLVIQNNGQPAITISPTGLVTIPSLALPSSVLNNGTLMGTTTNTGTISGGSLTGVVVTSGTISGTVVNSGTIAGGTYSGTPQFTGAAQGLTAANGDSTIKLATTAYVRTLGPACSPTQPVITTSTTLTATAAGQCIYLNASVPITITLPLSSTVFAGGSISFTNIGSASDTIAPQGSDAIPSRPAPIILTAGDAWTVFSNGTATWRTWDRFDNASANATRTVEQYGAVGDEIQVSGTVSIASGLSALTVVGATFTANDCHSGSGCTGPVDKGITIPLAGAASAPLATTITSFASATQVGVAATAGSTLAAVASTVTYGTPNTTAFTNCLNAQIATGAAPYGACRLSLKAYYLDASLTIPPYVQLIGSANGMETNHQVNLTAFNFPRLALAPATTLNITGGLSGAYVVNAAVNLTCATQQCDISNVANNFTGTGITFVGSAQVDNVLVAGFAQGINTNSSTNWSLTNTLVDGVSGVLVTNNHDWMRMATVTAKPVVVSTITPATVAVSGAADNGSGLVRLTVSSTAQFATGNTVIVYGIGGVPSVNQRWTATVVDGTHLDLQGSTFSGTYTAATGNVQLRAIRTGKAYAVDHSEGVLMTDVAEFGYDTCMDIGTNAGWTKWNGYCDNYAIPDPATTAINVHSNAYGSRLDIDYLSSYFNTFVNNVVPTNNYSPTIITGGQLYTTATQPVNTFVSGLQPTISVLAGNVIMSNVQMPGQYLTVATGAGLQIANCSNTSSVLSGITLTSFWYTGTDLGHVQVANCPIAVASGATIVNEPVVVVPSATVTNGATVTLSGYTYGLVLANAGTIAGQTVLFPAITGEVGQSVWTSSTGGIGTVTFKTSAGGAVGSAALAAGHRITYTSDGTTWQPAGG